jgi:Rad and Gem related GTP binding protein 1
MTSEYIGTYDASLDDEFGEKTVSILLDGEESELIFIDHPSHEMSVSFINPLNSINTLIFKICIHISFYRLKTLFQHMSLTHV